MYRTALAEVRWRQRHWTSDASPPCTTNYTSRQADRLGSSGCWLAAWRETWRGCSSPIAAIQAGWIKGYRNGTLSHVVVYHFCSAFIVPCSGVLSDVGRSVYLYVDVCTSVRPCSLSTVLSCLLSPGAMGGRRQKDREIEGFTHTYKHTVRVHAFLFLSYSSSRRLVGLFDRTLFPRVVVPSSYRRSSPSRFQRRTHSLKHMLAHRHKQTQTQTYIYAKHIHSINSLTH